MAPKKQHHQQQRKPTSKASSESKPSSSDAKPAPKLQISAENERRVRRLLLNTERPAALPTPPAAAGDGETKDRKAKRLRNVYDKLSLEGFSPDQIELALSDLNEGATYEAALDWLCLNIPGHELPLKFSSGVSSSIHEERSVKVISAAQSDWVPKQHPVDESRDDMSGASIRIKGHRDEELIELGKSSQAEWIRRYVEQEEEEEEEQVDPSSRAATVTKEYAKARLQALLAKQKGDRKNQDYYGEIISKLKKEASSLGLSGEMLETRFEDDNTMQTLEEVLCDSISCPPPELKAPGAADNCSDGYAPGSEPVVDLDVEERSSLEETEHTVNISENPGVGKDRQKNEASEDLELGNLFSEDSTPIAALPPERSKQHKKDKLRERAYGYTIGNIDDVWKKGDFRKMPKAVLQKLCQKLGWDAPKYNKVAEKENKFLYSVSILRTATGRGKSRKAGGLLILRLPEQFEDFGSVEDAQNSVAAFFLSHLFHDLPLCQMLMEPYSSLVSKWLEDEQSTKLEDRENTRRADFVESLLCVDASETMADLDASSVSTLEKSLESCNIEREDPDYIAEGTPLAHAGSNNLEQAESNLLKKLWERKTKLPKYQNMLRARAALPIAKLKNQFLQLLNENDVMVISGETGCGKTTQVPQFILDDMIESGNGGYCNIVCTQPRRIAAISVAERVSDERCEPSPGCPGSLVGFQVRLDSARNENTRLLFCTTGILLRKLAGNKDLAGITHVIVDEVHERSSLGDFLLIILKQLIKKQSSHGRKLKVILMSATVDATLFSSYFGNCPVIHAGGRTHPVSTCFLEDVYEMLNYSLPSDSPASGILMPTSRTKPAVSSVDNHRGKKNLVLSAWGDDSLLSEDYINPDYIPSLHESYSERTRQNLKNLVEDVIDYDLLEELICYIDEVYPPGAILVFLPGVAEINSLIDRLIASYQFRGMSSDWILPLHSSVVSMDQKRVFLSPPHDIRKVIVATDIAETSITIDDVTYVIDTGKHKESRYNPQKKMSSMVEDWISQANANQRRGRAGRVKPGICFCLYTRHRLEKLMRPFQVPEMLRMPLTELCLHIKSLSLGAINSFLMEAIEPPREEAISSAVDLLYKVGALEGEEELSPLGYHLAKLPVDVLIGKMMLYGAIFGCLSPILSTAAFLSYKTPFVSLKDEKQDLERAKAALLSDNLENGTASCEAYRYSDHLLMVVAYDKWAKILCKNGAKAAYQFCRSYFLNSSVMYMIRDMRVQLGILLADIGIVDLPKSFLGNAKRKDKLASWFADLSRPFNMYSLYPCIIKSIICAGLYPNVVTTMEGSFGVTLGCDKAHTGHPGKDLPLWHDGRREVHIHPTSTNYNVKAFRYPFLVFLEKVETSKVFVRDTSMVSPYSILLFGGSISIQHQAGLVIVDGWLKLNSPAQVAVLFKELRLTLHAVLKKLIREPEVAKIANNEVLTSIIHLLLEEDKVR